MSTSPFPPDEKTTESVVPGVRALDDPASRFAAYLAEERLLAPTSDVWSNPSKPHRGSNVRVVVSLVEAEMLGAPRAARAAHDDSVEHFTDHVRVRNVRASDERGDGHAASVGQDVPFDAAFRTVRGVWTREVPPFGAFTEALSREAHFKAAPRRP